MEQADFSSYIITCIKDGNYICTIVLRRFAERLTAELTVFWNSWIQMTVIGGPKNE